MAGGYGAGDPPDPIPNSEVKTRCADGTAGAHPVGEYGAAGLILRPTPASIHFEAGVGLCVCPGFYGSA